ncbi:MAG TPA: type II secretion system protein GspD [Candidatus Paceibacterota bacterium]|nr:type II secretion system protein GspD [Verrucomicrobiota bacterium]HSA10826.1 type II secretion system protein GspD [Candidatus Paceibacterota bacterium]
MLSRFRLSLPSKAAAAVALLLLSLTSCQHSQPKAPGSPPVKYNKNYDPEIKEIMDLAGRGQWEEAQTKATALREMAPKNAAVERVYSWVVQTGQQRREQALENQIREIDAKNSVFNPTVKSLLTENKDRGLPATKDVRDAVDRIENSPWIPETYGKTVREQGPLFDFESAKGRMAKVLEKEVTVHLDNVPLETILVNLSQTAGVNIVADKSLPALKQLLSANLDKVRLGEFLRYIARNYELQFQVGDQLVWVVDAKDPKKLMEETRFYRLRKGFVLPAEFGTADATRTTTTAGPAVTVTEFQRFQRFVNDLAPTLPALERAITNLFTGSKYMIDYERNLVVARGTPEQLDVMEDIIKEFDQPIQQVLIEARFVTISKPAFMQLGVLWQTGRLLTNGPPADFTGLVNNQNFPATVSPLTGGLNPAVGGGISEVFTNVLGAADLSATISALEQSGESQTLSAPRLTVLNNRPATISDGQVQYYYEEYSVSATVQQYYTASSIYPSGRPTKVTAGAELHVLASISGDGKSILLALNPKVNTQVLLQTYTTVSQVNQSGDVTSSFEIKLPTYRTQELSTRVAIKSGETVVMGGVLEREKTTYVESVPVLGDIPILGALFRRRTEMDTPRYLLIFVTATIVKDTGEFLVYEDEHSATNSPAK